MEDTEIKLKSKVAFLSEFLVAFKEQIHTDVRLKPGKYGPPIPAHKALLAARSIIFKNMLDSDECKAPIPAHKALLAARSIIFKNMLDSDECKAPAGGIITLPEFNHEELESFLEFLYSGALPVEKLQRHVGSLLIAADKYDIPYLQEFCHHHMLGWLNSSNALDVLELSDTSSNKTLKEAVLDFIVKHMEEVVLPANFEGFAQKNPHLSVQIIRAYLMDTKAKSISRFNTFMI